MINASVIICAYTMERWEQLQAAVISVRGQTRPASQILVVIDGNEELRRRAATEFGGVTVLENSKTPGLSGGRMTGAEAAVAPILVFLDDDAVAEPTWLEQLLRCYEDPAVLGVGGYIRPIWSGAEPAWFPPEFYWVVGCTYAGMPVRNGRIRNPIGASMSVRAEVLARAGGFASQLGRREGERLEGGIAESCEETEFCIRATRLNPGSYWAYCATARVGHHVPPQRMAWRYFVRRCRMEGTAKAVLTDMAGTKDGLGSERRYVIGLCGAVLRSLASGYLRRAGAICGGFGITALAYFRTRALIRAVRKAPSGYSDRAAA
ncbi:MAG: glycosyltransferase family 2 protein [Alphaproteobacteria bacterium]|nr:glycosyltransferase family 2 protein [Alphaproteobacteria bacterium]